MSQNPHFHSIMSKMLDAKLKTMLPNEKSDKSDQDKQQRKGNCITGDVRMLNSVKSPSDTTIYAPALAKQTNNMNKGSVNIEQRINDFVGAVRRQQEMADGREGTSSRSGYQHENERLSEMEGAR